MISLDRYIVTKDGQILDKQRDCKPIKYFKSNKYLQCCIFDNNGKHTVGVHNVVAQAHCNDWFEGCVVHHKDNNQQNNKAENLECFDLAEHTKLHNPQKYYDKIMFCPTCKQEFVWTAEAQSRHARSKAKSEPFCSRICASNKTKGGCKPTNTRSIRCVENGTVYSSIREASDKLGIYYSAISKVLRGVHKSTKGMHFEYA